MKTWRGNRVGSTGRRGLRQCLIEDLGPRSNTSGSDHCFIRMIAPQGLGSKCDSDCLYLDNTYSTGLWVKNAKRIINSIYDTR